MHESEAYRYAATEPVKSYVSRCAGQVRYSPTDGVLQQLWVITEYMGSSPSGQREEWRDVPVGT